MVFACIKSRGEIIDSKQNLKFRHKKTRAWRVTYRSGVVFQLWELVCSFWGVSVNYIYICFFIILLGSEKRRRNVTSPSEETLSEVKEKLNRAKHHYRELETEINTFLETKPFEVCVKINAETKPVHYIAKAEPTPPILSVIAGDIIQNLRTSLDHLAYQIVLKETDGNPENKSKIYFPIGNDAHSYNSQKGTNLRGISEECMNDFDEIAPYQGGNDLIWQLHKLNIIEKHRLLLTVGTSPEGVNLAQLLGLKDFPNLYFKEESQLPLEIGTELVVGQPGEEAGPGLKFIFSVSIYEEEILSSGQTLHKYIKKLIDETEKTIDSLANRL